MAVEFEKIYVTVGYDVNTKRAENLNKYIDRTLEIASGLLSTKLFNGILSVNTNKNDIKDCNVFIVTFPTPTDKNNRPIQCSYTYKGK